MLKHLIHEITYDVFISVHSYYLITFFATVFIFVFWLLFFAKRYFTKHGITVKSILRAFAGFLLVACYIMLSFETIFSRPPGSRGGLQYLFDFGGIFTNPLGARFEIENIILFIPLGFLICSLCKRKMRFFKTTFLCILTSVTIETTQYFTARGFAQISDVVFNTLGGIFGLLLFILCELIFKNIRHKKNKHFIY